MTEYRNLMNQSSNGLFEHYSLLGGNEYGKSCHLYIFTSLKQFMMN